MKTCVFAGTFDPITNGHVFVINKCLEAFDKVVIAVGVNVDKTPTFTLQERMEMIKLAFNGQTRVEVKEFSGMLVDFMRENEIKINVRGLRDERDYQYETTMAQYNLDLYPDLVTLYMPTPLSLSHVSSSAMRNIIKNGGDISLYVPKEVATKIKNIKNI